MTGKQLTSELLINQVWKPLSASALKGIVADTLDLIIWQVQLFSEKHLHMFFCIDAG